MGAEKYWPVCGSCAATSTTVRLAARAPGACAARPRGLRASAAALAHLTSPRRALALLLSLAGARAYLLTQYKWLSLWVAVMFVLITLVIGLPASGGIIEGFYTALCFIVGSVLSVRV